MTPVHFSVAKNIILAEIPFILAIYLFVIANQRNVLWWLLCAVFIAFLPNAAYTLTDIIHFIAAVKSPDYSSLYVFGVMLPLFVLYMFVNFQFYVISIMLAQHYIGKNWGQTIAIWFVPAIQFLCAIGVYLGRVQRLNSTDIATNPLIVFKDLYLDLTSLHPLMIIIGFFVLFYVMYLIFSKLNTKIWNAKFAKYWHAIEAMRNAAKPS